MPSGAPAFEQVFVTLSQMAKAETLFDPELAANRNDPLGVMVRPVGLVPARYGREANCVSAPELEMVKAETVLLKLFET